MCLEDFDLDLKDIKILKEAAEPYSIIHTSGGDMWQPKQVKPADAERHKKILHRFCNKQDCRYEYFHELNKVNADILDHYLKVIAVAKVISRTCTFKGYKTFKIGILTVEKYRLEAKKKNVPCYIILHTRYDDSIHYIDATAEDSQIDQDIIDREEQRDGMEATDTEPCYQFDWNKFIAVDVPETQRPVAPMHITKPAPQSPQRSLFEEI